LCCILMATDGWHSGHLSLMARIPLLQMKSQYTSFVTAIGFITMVPVGLLQLEPCVGTIVVNGKMLSLPSKYEFRVVLNLGLATAAENMTFSM
jgi:hypothetical protein